MLIIGSGPQAVRVEPNLVLAPMEGITDLPFRRLVRGVGGVGLTVTEFVASEGLRHGSRKMLRMAAIDPDERPVAIQIFGRRPAVMAEAARRVEDLGASICDINMGCPSKKVCAHSGGSALMKEPKLAAAIVAAVRAAVRIPVTVKMRSGFDATQRNAPEIAGLCEAEGADAVAIHWRTRADRYGGQRAVDKIAEARDRVSIPVLANGDVVCVESAMTMFRDTGAAGLLIGRGAVRNPWLFQQIAAHQRGEDPPVVTPAQRWWVLASYLDAIQAEIQNEKGVAGKFKQIVKHFVYGLPDERRREILRARSVAELTELTAAYFADLESASARSVVPKICGADPDPIAVA